MSTPKKRDLPADLIRCLGCIFVILLHLRLPFQLNNSIYTYIQIFITTLTADGVILFFSATGFFIFREKNILKRWKKALISVFLPGFIALVFYLFAHRWLKGEMTLIKSIKATGIEDFKELVFHLLRFSVPAYAGHLWYLEEYLKCLLYYPLLLFICTEDKTAVYVRRGIILLSFVFLLIQDAAHIGLSPMIHMAPFRIVSTPAMMMLIGYELYEWKNHRKNKDVPYIPGIICGIIVFILINILRSVILIKALGNNPQDEFFLGWDTSFSVISGTGLVLAVFSAEIKNKAVTSFIGLTAPCTYGIYLIHVALVNRMDSFKIRDRLINAFHSYSSPAGYLLLLTVTGIITFILCLLIVWIWHLIKKALFKKKASSQNK